MHHYIIKLFKFYNYIINLGITSHYVNNNFELVSNFLALKFIPQSHTGLYLSTEIVNLIESWKIKDKCINATIDGASNINLAIQSIPFLDKLRCFTHVLNLVTKNILEENNDLKLLNIIKKYRSLVCTFIVIYFLSNSKTQWN
jgi:hypothetical protein